VLETEQLTVQKMALKTDQLLAFVTVSKTVWTLDVHSVSKMDSLMAQKMDSLLEAAMAPKTAQTTGAGWALKTDQLLAFVTVSKTVWTLDVRSVSKMDPLMVQKMALQTEIRMAPSIYFL